MRTWTTQLEAFAGIATWLVAEVMFFFFSFLFLFQLIK
jgi:hypothetical protein